jgi:hypothetical protein
VHAALLAALLAVAPGPASAQAPQAPPPTPDAPTPDAPAPDAPAGPGAAAEREVRPEHVASRVEPRRVLLGAPLVYELALTHPKEHRYELATEGALGAFEVLGQERSRDDAGQRAVTTFRVRLALYELGEHPLPELAFEVATPEGRGRFRTRGPSVEGVSALPPDAQAQGAALKDLKPPEDVPVRSWRLLGWLAGGLLALGAAYALWRLWRRPRPSAPAVVAPALPLEERTLAALQALGAEGLPARGLHKEFYSRLTDVLRGYLGERYRFEARECTTGELVSVLHRLRAGGLPLEPLRDFLEEADLVKFAKMQVDASACDAALAFGRRLVTATTPAPPAAPPPPGPAAPPGAPRHAPP